MLSINTIKSDLRDIKTYYKEKEIFEAYSKYVGECSVKDLVNKYNACICKAPVKLYQLYVNLYVKNQTSLYEFSINEGYSEIYIQKLHSSLLHYFQENLEVAAWEKLGIMATNLSVA